MRKVSTKNNVKNIGVKNNNTNNIVSNGSIKRVINRGIKGIKFVFETLVYLTKTSPYFQDITDDIKKIVKKSGILNGIAFVFSLHTTCSIKINENEPLLLEDMGRFLNKLAPITDNYKHNDFSIRTVNMCDDECKNGHAHCQQSLMGTSELLPVKGGDLVLGQWQRVLLIEMDRPRERKVLVEVMGA